MRSKNKPTRSVLVLAAGAGLVAMAGAVAGPPPSSASFSLPRQSVDSGGGAASSARFQVEASIGQPDAGPVASSARFELRSGFQRAAEAGEKEDRVFSDRFESS